MTQNKIKLVKIFQVYNTQAAGERLHGRVCVCVSADCVWAEIIYGWI